MSFLLLHAAMLFHIFVFTALIYGPDVDHTPHRWADPWKGVGGSKQGTDTWDGVKTYCWSAALPAATGPWTATP